jgi:hypothetical protein
MNTSTEDQTSSNQKVDLQKWTFLPFKTIYIDTYNKLTTVYKMTRTWITGIWKKQLLPKWVNNSWQHDDDNCIYECYLYTLHMFLCSHLQVKQTRLNITASYSSF